MNISSHKLLAPLKVIIAALILAVGIQYLFADVWGIAPANPPNCPSTTAGCNAPINAGTSWQYKNGSLTIAPGATIPTQIPSPNTPALDVIGGGIFDNLGITGNLVVGSGNPIIPGEVLTAQDASGTVGWAANGGSGGVTGIIAGSNVTVTGTVGGSDGVVTGVVTINSNSGGTHGLKVFPTSPCLGNSTLNFCAKTYSWTAPIGVTSALVQVWGGGGGGANDKGGGGSGGGYAESEVTVVPGTNYTITVGSAGEGGEYNYGGGPLPKCNDSSYMPNGTTAYSLGGNGTNGGSSSFGTGDSLVSASGGGGGYSNYCRDDYAYYDYPGTPGNGTSGTIELSGQYGGLGVSAVDYTYGGSSPRGGVGGAGGGDMGSDAESFTAWGNNSTGASGQWPGGGGSGYGDTAVFGGNGAGGGVVVEW
jgi:hypothetical protein